MVMINTDTTTLISAASRSRIIHFIVILSAASGVGNKIGRNSQISVRSRSNTAATVCSTAYGLGV